MLSKIVLIVGLVGGWFVFIALPILSLGLYGMYRFWKAVDEQRHLPIRHPALTLPTAEFLDEAQEGLEPLGWDALAQDSAVLRMEGKSISDNWHYRGRLLCGDAPWLAYDLRNQLGAAQLEVRTARQRLSLEIDSRPFREPTATVLLDGAPLGRIVTLTDEIVLISPSDQQVARYQRVRPLSVSRLVDGGLQMGTVQHEGRTLCSLNAYVKAVPHWVTVPTRPGALLGEPAPDLQASEADGLLALVAFDIFRRIGDVIFYNN